jgi:voltage-gated potassium channel
VGGEPTTLRAWRRLTRRLQVLVVFTAVVLFLCPVGYWLFEHGHSPEARNIGSGYQWLFRTIFETSSAYKLHTGPGFVVYYVVRLAGVSLVAFASGAIASRLVTTVIQKGKGLGSTRASGHILICGWSAMGPEILRELHSSEVDDPRRVVVLADWETDPTKLDHVEFLRGDPSDADDLFRAGLDRCSTAIVLADDSSNAGDHDRDARSLLTCLAIESIDPETYTCVEIIQSSNRKHFERTRVNELIVTAELTGSLLAGAAVQHGFSRLIRDLVTHPDGQEFYRLPVPSDLAPLTFGDALLPIKQRHDATAVGLVMADDRYWVNPPVSTALADSSDLLVIMASNGSTVPTSRSTLRGIRTV